jgi:hypothetical protein
MSRLGSAASALAAQHGSQWEQIVASPWLKITIHCFYTIFIVIDSSSSSQKQATNPSPNRHPRFLPAASQGGRRSNQHDRRPDATTDDGDFRPCKNFSS